MKRPNITRKQIEDHPLIHPEYKADMLREWDEYEKTLNRRVRLGMYLILLIVGALAICMTLSGCSDKDSKFQEEQAALQWKIDSLERARQSDGFQDEQEQAHEREYNSAENEKLNLAK